MNQQQQLGSVPGASSASDGSHNHSRGGSHSRNTACNSHSRNMVGNSRSHNKGSYNRTHNKGNHNRSSHGDRRDDIVVANSQPLQLRYSFSSEVVEFRNLALLPLQLSNQERQ